MSEIEEKIIADEASDGDEVGSAEEADPDVKDVTNKKKKKKKKSKGELQPENDFPRKMQTHAAVIELKICTYLVM